ncbi:hypothetical protein GCM10018781_65540 [Kitasatospora indigofera]|uniref:Dynamin family protein n=1 Tax=Kitasatospora indigofera TaxID=67307 RepID=A0A919GD18_9ACTN|nr:hypothetical protein [Kitasatospora indigofera]GHH81918.1 hypothetical protein GCM10018781_65540 [Kitasatospora indigofera]
MTSGPDITAPGATGPATAARIDALLENRRGLLVTVETETARWQRTGAALGRLDEVLARLRAHRDASERLREVLGGPGLRDLRSRVAELLDQYGHAAARFSRGTVNLGVSGQARVGKSTLLQSLSGLTDDQIPTGSGVPVTAVRSRIFHTPGRSRAVVGLHTPGSFLAESVRPYHALLGLASAPETLEEFAHQRLPDEVDDSLAPLLQRLRGMQRGLWSYRDDLTGGEREVPLAELRGYVAYPTQSEVDAGEPARRYLAVREARIECPFPHAGVDRIGIVDLPGLGEVAADAERRHVAGLRHDVDAVLLVKRPLEGMAYFGAADSRALALLEEARGLVRRTGDFVFIVVNRGKDDAEGLTAALLGHLASEVDAGRAGRRFSVLQTDAADPHAVGADLLAPLLAALADRLPVMDGDIVGGLAERAGALADAVRAEVAALTAALAGLRGHASAPAEDLERQAEGLREDVAAELGEVVADLRAEVLGGFEDEHFTAAVEDAYADVSRWLARGLGTAGQDRTGPDGAGDPEAAGAAGDEDDAVHRQRWCARQLRQMRVHNNAAPVAADELNRIRVEIGRRFSSVDTYFEERVRRLHTRVADVLGQHTGELLAAEDGTVARGAEALGRFRALLDDGYEPCPELSAAVAELLALRLDYRTQLYPRIRAQLDGLNLEVLDPGEGQMRSQIAVAVNPAGVEELYDFITVRAEQAAYRTRKALLRDSVLPGMVLFAAVEQFEDALIRSGTAGREFRRLARTYRDELWPGRYGGLNSEHARFAAVARACEEIEVALRGGPGPRPAVPGPRPAVPGARTAGAGAAGARAAGGAQAVEADDTEDARWRV